MEIQDDNRLLRQSEQSVEHVTNDQLENTAPTQQVAEQWIQLSNNLHYILVSACDVPASTTHRQNTQGDGFETWRLTHSRYSIPLGTRSVGYLTRLRKPQFDEQKFEESFTTWEFQLSKYEQDNNTQLPDVAPVAFAFVVFSFALAFALLSFAFVVPCCSYVHRRRSLIVAALM